MSLDITLRAIPCCAHATRAPQRERERERGEKERRREGETRGKICNIGREDAQDFRGQHLPLRGSGLQALKGLSALPLVVFL